MLVTQASTCAGRPEATRSRAHGASRRAACGDAHEWPCVGRVPAHRAGACAGGGARPRSAQLIERARARHERVHALVHLSGPTATRAPRRVGQQLSVKRPCAQHHERAPGQHRQPCAHDGELASDRRKRSAQRAGTRSARAATRSSQRAGNGSRRRPRAHRSERASDRAGGHARIVASGHRIAQAATRSSQRAGIRLVQAATRSAQRAANRPA